MPLVIWPVQNEIKNWVELFICINCGDLTFGDGDDVKLDFVSLNFELSLVIDEGCISN